MKRQIVSLALVAALAVGTIPLVGCTSLQAAQRAQSIISALLKAAPGECALISPQYVAACNNWVALGVTLDTQAETCITNVSGLMGKSAKFGSCFTTFATGLMSATELAQFHVFDPASQSRVQDIIAGMSIAVNLIVSFTTPLVASTPATSAELHDLGIRAGLKPQELAYAGL